VTESLKLANIDKDGKIDYKEFAKVLQPKPKPKPKPYYNLNLNPNLSRTYKIGKMDYKEFAKVLHCALRSGFRV
jgi:Ca2+-binding EF-hand superfamily protein